MPKGVFPRRHAPYAERFWRRVVCDLASGCWLWTGGTSGGGYGHFSMGGRLIRKQIDAHRLSWEMHYGNHPCLRGPMLPGVCVLHRCDTRACVRPDHLFLGTKGDNNRDKYAKGRGFGGETHPRHKLTDAQVREIRALRGRSSRKELAQRFGVTYMTISRAERRILWRNVT